MLAQFIDTQLLRVATMARTTAPAGQDEITANDASEIARELFGLKAPARRMAGLADLSFRLGTEAGPMHVLKISPAGANLALLRMQNALLMHLSHAPLNFAVPGPMTDREGRRVSAWSRPGCSMRAVRLLTFLPGELVCDRPPPDARVLRSIGRGLAGLDKALLDFEHPDADRHHSWDLACAEDVCRAAPLAPDVRKLVEQSLEAFRRNVVPELPGLRHSVIHGDVNDHNLLVSARPGQGVCFSGLIDFGDALRAPLVFELAIALAYFMMRQEAPLPAGQELVAAYHSCLPLTDTELEILYDLVCTRLSMSLCHSARGRAAAPDNAYLTRSEEQAHALLRQLRSTHRGFATATFREACRKEPWPDGAALAAWLADQDTSPLLRGLDEPGVTRVLDFTPRSADLGGVIAPPDVRAFGELVNQRVAEAGARFGIGRYGEIRGLYHSEVFAPGADHEPRTVHLGVDIFAPAGTEVFAPLAGVVHSFAENVAPLDYGPTVILEHSGPGEGGTFYTLYGHLSRDSLCGLSPGKQVSKGQLIARLGDETVNGGWPPHLHFQVLTDLLGYAGDFPGVARHSEAGVWLSLCPNPARFAGLSEQALDARCGDSPAALARRRDCCLSPSLSLSFASPIKVVRGRGAHLYTEQGRKILDLVNNVAHVGHAQPQVVAAICHQEALLNTNTRYLHDGLVSYAERLTGLMPAPLDTCFMVCSGSEANDLALRLARAHSGGTDVVVLEGAYHGNLGAMVDLSPYKFAGPGGGGRAAHVQLAAVPDTYNGAFAGEPDAALRYAESVAQAFARSIDAGRRPAAFICESALGCGGQIILPDGYLEAAYAQARKVGAVCIADEVQVGFGRLGKHMWAFDHQGVVPDIVTLGKPIGNGYPMAAVVTRREIADSLANGMEYFNTFGGNPVACAAGHAVLDVIEQDALVAHATALGEEWLAALADMTAEVPLVGDLRGRGLFIGLELVRDRSTRAPAPSRARQVVELMKEEDIQIGLDGPRYNVLKIKPPMVIGSADAERVVVALQRAFAELT